VDARRVRRRLNARRTAAPVLLLAALVLGAACSDDDVPGSSAPSPTSGLSSVDPTSLLPSGLVEQLKPGPCVEPWIVAFNALDPSRIAEGFDVTGAEFDGVQAQCPFDGLSDRDKSHVFGAMDPDVQKALQDAGFIQFVPSGTPINN
jgi:hypothetical protein